MTSHIQDIDTLIAALHPHVFMGLFNYKLHPPTSLQPSKDTAEFRDFVQAFATLFSFHPGCDAAAVAAQTSQPGNSSLHICLSPSIPHEFKENVEKWLNQFMALRRESKSARNVQRGDTFSPLERCFILDTYRVCYSAMHQQTASHGFGDWDVFVDEPRDVDETQAGFVDEPPAVTDTVQLKPTEDEEQLRETYAVELEDFSKLVRSFAACLSGRSLGEDESDVLEFHKLCMDICDKMSSDGFSEYLDEYIYCGDVGPRLTYFNLPRALSTLLSLSQTPKISQLDDEWGSDILDTSKGVRQFSAVMTKAFLAKRFGEEPGIKWENVVQAFQISAARPNGSYGMGYQWDADKNLLSTAGPVTLHPEMTLIQHLLENSGRKAEAYIACSRTPCYASAMYAVAVNNTLNTRFTMHIDDPEWCQLYSAKPWILLEDTQSDIMTTMKEYLLRDLNKLVQLWVQERWSNVQILSSDDNLAWG
ncbi:hypothetical protein LXA43DRAFT_641473 [Ganoderma leucocontextum]|nr:hypothetical protein LXA43DRAFT_641473 [Ganoderma leucocontextum]